MHNGSRHISEVLVADPAVLHSYNLVNSPFLNPLYIMYDRRWVILQKVIFFQFIDS